MTRPLLWRLAWSAALAALFSSSAFGDTLSPVTLDQLCVTEGHLTATGGQLSVTDASMRAIAAASSGQSAEVQFTYLGPTAVTAALGSGEVRQQFGLKLLAANPCNLVYAMWRFTPQPRVVVQVKSNPGESTSRACGNQGYRTIAPSQTAPVAAPALGAPHRLAATIAGSTLTVRADGVRVWEGELPPGALALDGPAGIRSDNASLTFSLLASLTGAAPAGCPTGSED
jgi:hypothetical protein